jgi:hypothetical protein
MAEIRVAVIVVEALHEIAPEENTNNAFKKYDVDVVTVTMQYPLTINAGL